MFYSGVVFLHAGLDVRADAPRRDGLRLAKHCANQDDAMNSTNVEEAGHRLPSLHMA